MAEAECGDDAFVGRVDELRRIEAALAASRRGRGRLVMVSGAAGIGKTRFCREVVTRAKRGGHRVVWGSCWAEGGAVPLWPWQLMLTELCGTASADLRVTPGRRGAAERERFAQFVAAGEYLSQACRDVPT